MSKNCIITTVKSKIKGNATSYIERENEIFIPVSKKFSLNQTRAIAQDKVNTINKEYLSEKFGEVVSLNTSYTNGTGINIHPPQLLIDAYEVKEGNKTIEEINSNRDLEYFNGDEALLEQEQNEDNLIQKELDNLIEQTNNIKFNENGQGLLFQKQTQSNEGIVVTEKTIRDLAARMSDRIGIPFKFESDRSKKYKGKLENGIAYINLAYADLTTPIHEILGHPIIRAIKNTAISKRKGFNLSNFEIKKDYKNNTWYIDFKPGYYREEFKSFVKTGFTDRKLAENSLKNNYSELYQNLLKELEYGKGKEVLDRIKRDYKYKVTAELIIDRFGRYGIKQGNSEEFVFDTKEEAEGQIKKINSKEYTLEEQQEEAIVELLGMLTAEKLDAVKDGKLISILKRLLKEIKAFMRDILFQKEVEIDKLPDNMTLGDLSDLLAYSNSKLILPGYEVEYTTPDNQQFKTYQEASNHISDLARSVENINLDKININNKLSEEDLKEIKKLEDLKQKEENYLNSAEYQEEKTLKLKELNEKLNEIQNKKVVFKSQEPSLTREDANKYGFEDYKFVRVESSYSRGYNPHPNFLNIDIGGKAYEGYYIHGYNTEIGKPSTKVIPITKEQAEEIWNKENIRIPDFKYEVDDRQNIYRLQDEIKRTSEDSFIKYKIIELENEIFRFKYEGNPIFGFIKKNKEYEQSKEIIEEWKKVNNIVYNPEEIYSRGQEFSSVVGAYSSFDADLMMQNLLQHIEDNEKAGGKFAISAYTKPIDKQIGHLEGGGGKIKFKLYPQSEDILWASNQDVYSGSVWDASEKVNKDKKSELLGVSYTKYPSLHNVKHIQPNLASVVDDLAHHHNELGIVLTGNNFRLEYDEDIPYTTKKIIDGINKILDQKYGELIKPKIEKSSGYTEKLSFLNQELEYHRMFKDEEPKAKIAYLETLKKIEELKREGVTGIRPTQTNETLKESIDSVKDNVLGKRNELNSPYSQRLKALEYYKDYKIEKDENGKWWLKVKNTLPSWYSTKEKAEEHVLKSIKDLEEELEENKPKTPQKEYNEQALINTKIAKLKEVAKKYPRSLIRSEVKRQTNSFGGYVQDQDLFPDDLLFQKIPSFNLSEKSAELKALPGNKWFNKVIQPIINRFSKMFPNVRSVVISEKEIPNEVKAIVDGLDKQINSFFHKGQVYIIKERVTKDVAIEEFLHPFVNALEQDNPELYKSLLLEAKKLFPELKEEVFTKYEKVYNSIFDKNREFLTQALTQKVSEQTPEQETFFQKFKTWIRNILDRLFGNEATTREISMLDETMSLTDLASILNENNTQFNFNSDTNTTYYSLNEEEITNYLNRPKTQIQAEILDKILENNKVTQTDFTGGRHEYTRNELGEILQLKPVSNFLSKKTNPELDFSDFAQIGNAIHEIVKNINLNLLPRTQLIDAYAEKSDLKRILVDEKGYPIEAVKQILSNIYDYVTPLIGSKESLLVSEVSISALQDLGEYKGVADTIDLLEITKDGNLVIHDFKSMYLNGLETYVYTNNPSTQLDKKFNVDNNTAYREQLSLCAKMLKGIVGNKNITLQIVPIGYLATSETKDKTIQVNFSDKLVKTNASLNVENYIYSPFNLMNVSKQQAKFQVTYFKSFVDKILPSIKDEEITKKLTKEEIDRQELLNNLTDEIKGENSKVFEAEIEKVFKQITTVVTQYGNSQNELNRELYKIFDPKGELKETKANFDIIFKTISDKKGDDLKYYLSTLVQYINFIQEINVGLTNIKNHFHVIKSQEKSDTEKIAAYRKSYLLAKAQKERISKTLLQLDDISDDNLFKKMIKESIANIKEIEERYFNETLPLTANILNSYITTEFRERMTKELTDRIAKEKYDLNLVTSESSKKNINEKIEELEQRLVAFNDPNLITKIIKGEYGDGHWFDSNLVANINNSNYVISGTAVMMQHILQDIAVEAMRMEEKFGKEFRQREEAYGVNRDQVKAMNKDMVTTVQRFFENPDGTIETLDSMQYIVKVNQQVYEDYKKLEILFKNAKTDTEKEKALKDIKDFEKLHFESKYNPKYLNVLNKLDVTVSDGRNVMEVRQKIFDQITRVRLSVGKEEYKEGNISDEDLQILRDLQRDLFNLSSSFDRNGNKKTKKADLEIAEILQKRAKELEEFRDKKVDEEVWKRLKTKKIQSLLDKYNTEEEVLKSEEYKKWQSFNSVISPTEEFYELRQSKLNAINLILDKKEYKDIALVGQLKDNLNQSWEKLNALSREYRDFEREFISQDIPEGSKKAMKILEENIDKVKTQIKGLEKSLSKEDKKSLNNLWEDYNSMVEYKTSKYYEEDLEIALNKYALENEIEVSELKNDKSLMVQFRLNSDWYINSHITKERYDKVSGETVKYTEPVYYYKTVVPTNPDYIKESPAYQYSTFELKPEAYNLDENGNPNYLDVFGRPKIKESSKYITENIPYLKAKNDLSTKGKINFQNVNFITSVLEDVQKDLNKNNLIYYQVPSKFKSTFERGSEGDLKSIKQNIVDGLMRMNNDEKEFGTRGVLANLSGEEMQFIPVLGKYKLDFKDQSYDVWQSTLEYVMSAKKAKMFEERLPIFDVLVDQLEKNTPAEDPNKVEAIGNSMAKKFGLNNVTEAIKGKGTNTLQAVKDEISRGVYEEFTKELANWRGISDVKITNTVLGFAGTTMMIGKIPNWIVNAMSGNVQVMIEAAGKRYYTPTDVKNAKVELGKKSKEVLEDISKISDKSLIGQLTDFFDPMKGEFIDNLGNKFSWSKRTNLTKIFFFGKIFGEWEMQMTTFIAMLKAKKVEQILPNGTKKMIDLYDAFERGEDGVPKLKEGVQFSQKDLIDYKLRIQGVNKMLNGSYAKMDQTKIEKYSIGKATMFMKKYLIPLFVQRFGEFRGDMELQDVREGHYRIFYNALLTDIKNLGLGNISEIYAKMNKPPEQGGYTDLQKQAIKKTLAEFAIIAAIFISLGLLGYGDDDDDSDSVKFAQYIALKLKREVGLFTPFAATQELTSLIERPFIAVGAASNVIDLVGTTAKLPFNWAFDAFEDDLYYQRKTALWDKGDSKIISLLLKTAGVQVAITNPEQLLQSYKYSIR